MKKILKSYLARHSNILNIAKLVLNLFFRNNNLISAYIKAYRNNNHIVIDRSSNLYNCKISILGGGNFVSIGGNCSLSGMSIYIDDSNNTLQIGDRVNVNASPKSPTRFNACGGSKIIIGSDSLFSNSIELHTTDYHPIYDMNNERTNTPSPIVIGEHSWIGLRTIVLKGVVIQPYTIIGACSVVVKSNSASNEVLAGNPAKVIKKGYNWALSEIQYINESNRNRH